jgi:preprotein translocase subunit SecD
MLQIPLFNRIMIVLVILAGLSFAMPNLFYERVERHNDAAAEIEATGVTSDENAAALAGGPRSCPRRWSIWAST